MSYGRMPSRSTPATSRSARSPMWWPNVSLMSLKLSRSMTSSEISDVSRSARASRRDTGRLEVGGRPRVDQRPPVAGHPAGETVAVADGQQLNRLRVDAGRVAAVQRIAFIVVEEEGAALERHDGAQLRRDEGH